MTESEARLPDHVAQAYEDLEAAVYATVDFKVLLAAVWQIGEIDHELEPQKLHLTVRSLNHDKREELFGRVGIMNSWLHQTGAYQQPSSQKSTRTICALPDSVIGAHRDLDQILSADSKHRFLESVVDFGRLLTISSDIDAARSAGDSDLGGIEYSLFDIALGCPVLAWSAKNELLRGAPKYFEASWAYGRIVGGIEEYDRIFDVGDPIDYHHMASLRDFFQGLHHSQGRLIRDSSEHLRRRAYLLRGETSRLTDESDRFGSFEDFGLASFPDAIRLVLENEAIKVSPFGYKVVLGPPRNEKWLVCLPSHEFWFVEQATPWTLQQYKSDPLAFIRKHFNEISRSTASRWSLDKADLLEALAIEFSIEGFVPGLTEMALYSARRASHWATASTLAAQQQVAQKLAELTQQVPADLSSKFVARLLAVLVVEIALHHHLSVDDAVKAAAIQVVYEFFLHARSGTPKNDA